MSRLLFITHPEVIVDRSIPIERWRLSDRGAARMAAFAESQAVVEVASIWSSTETKAMEAAGILAAGLRLNVQVKHELHENDRSATGFLPPEEFEATANWFFAEPHKSVRGWERAIDAQRRIRAAVDSILAGRGNGDVAIVAHGGVGTLLLCDMRGLAISRAHDQPYQGHYWVLDLATRAVERGWTALPG